MMIGTGGTGNVVVTDIYTKRPTRTVYSRAVTLHLPVPPVPGHNLVEKTGGGTAEADRRGGARGSRRTSVEPPTWWCPWSRECARLAQGSRIALGSPNEPPTARPRRVGSYGPAPDRSRL